MNILITGKNGFLGKELTSFFTNTKYNVLSTCRKTLDVSSEKQVDDFFRNNDVDVILHTAIKGARRTRQNTYNDLVENLNMFRNLYKHSEKYKFMISFGSGAEDDTKSYYGLAKNIIAREIKRYDGNIVNLRLFGCFGPSEDSTRFIKNSINRILKNDSILIHQNKYMDYFYIDDLKKVVLYYIKRYKDPLPKELDLCYTEKKDLVQLANIIKSSMRSKADIIVEKSGLGKSYTGDSEILSSLNLNFAGLERGISDSIT